MSKTPVDIVLMGAGMVGSLFALRLQQLAGDLPLRLHVLERSVPAPSAAANEPWGLRVSALSPGTLAALEQVGVLDALLQQRHASYTEMLVWDADGTGRVHFKAEAMGVPRLGMLVENNSLQRVLFDAITASGVELHCPNTWQSLTRTAEGWELILADGQHLHAPLMIAADGPGSPVREHLKRGVARWDYQQKALVATVAHSKPHGACAQQRFLPTGPLAFLPTDHPQQSSIVWTLPSAQADTLLQADELEFCSTIEHAFESELGTVSCLTPRAVFPLQAVHAEHYAQDQVVLLGDAAHSIHPLAGQGVNLGVQDAMCLAEKLVAQRRAGLPWSHTRAQRQYSRARRANNATMMHAMTGFERLFASDLPALRVLRNEGMRQFDRLTWLKQRVIQRALQG